MDDRAGGGSPAGKRHRFAPIIVNRAARQLGRSIKIVAFNAQGGAKLDGVIRCLQRPPLAGADVVLLCEAYWRHHWSAGREFAAELAAALEMSFAYLGMFAVPVSEGAPTSFAGIAILCSQPLAEARAIAIANRPIQRRLSRMMGGPAGLVARATFNGTAVNLGVVHLNSRWDPAGRAVQMGDYLAELSPDGPAIIGGDFNTTTVGLHGWRAFVTAARKFILEPQRLSDPRRWEGLFARIEQAGFCVDGANAPGRRTFTPHRLVPTLIRPKLDWFALRDLDPVAGSAQVVPARPTFFSRRVSDHDFIMCEVAVRGGTV